jgi:transcriptional regulator with XRE-family HTH domain
MLKNLSDNLNRLIQEARINTNELARQTGVAATTIKRIRMNEQSNPTITTLLPIAEFFKVSLDQLLGGKSCNTTYCKTLHLLDWTECNGEILTNLETHTKTVLTERYISKNAYALIIEDELDFFPKNCVLIIEPNRRPVHGDYVIIGKTNLKVSTIRKYVVDLDQVYLKPLVTGSSPCLLTPAFKILGVIIQYKVDLKDDTTL